LEFGKKGGPRKNSRGSGKRAKKGVLLSVWGVARRINLGICSYAERKRKNKKDAAEETRSYSWSRLKGNKGRDQRFKYTDWKRKRVGSEGAKKRRGGFRSEET